MGVYVYIYIYIYYIHFPFCDLRTVTKKGFLVIQEIPRNMGSILLGAKIQAKERIQHPKTFGVPFDVSPK